MTPSTGAEVGTTAAVPSPVAPLDQPSAGSVPPGPVPAAASAAVPGAEPDAASEPAVASAPAAAHVVARSTEVSAEGRPTGPSEALAALLAGNRRFVSGRPQHGHEVAKAAAASGGQLPHAVVLGCIDSRVPLEAIFDQTFGSICVIRSGAHVVDRAVLGSVGFAVDALNVPLIMVLGHERCGAVASTVESLRSHRRPDGDVGYLVDEIAPAVLATGLDHPDVAAKAMRVHVARTVRRLRDIPTVAQAVAEGRVTAVGAVYDLDTGWVDLLPVIRATPPV
jgi:carbonic anhydrase